MKENRRSNSERSVLTKFRWPWSLVFKSRYLRRISVEQKTNPMLITEHFWLTRGPVPYFWLLISTGGQCSKSFGINIKILVKILIKWFLRWLLVIGRRKSKQLTETLPRHLSLKGLSNTQFLSYWEMLLRKGWIWSVKN